MQMNTPPVLYESRASIGWITLNRPEVLNAINPDMLHGLLKILKEVSMDSTTRVLILTVHEKKEFVREMIQSGARGYIRKSTSPVELVSAIERIHRGEAFFMPDVAQAFFEEYVLSEGKL